MMTTQMNIDHKRLRPETDKEVYRIMKGVEFSTTAHDLPNSGF